MFSIVLNGCWVIIVNNCSKVLIHSGRGIRQNDLIIIKENSPKDLLLTFTSLKIADLKNDE